VTGRKIVLSGEPLVDGTTALRPWRDSDIGSLVAACQDPEIARWTRVPRPYGEADARAFLMRRFDDLQVGLSASFAIVSASDLEHLLGTASLLRFAWEHARAEVGYWLAAPARGHGHATRAVQLICAWGFRELGLERIELLAATGNPASQAVAVRTGFSREAVFRSYMRSTQERLDVVVFGLLRP
jgi:RimJ/RimL family protein N-acetyltransferase